MALIRSTSTWILALWLTAWGCAAEPASSARSDSVALSAGDLERGRALFLTSCALCHGELGDGHGVRRAGFQRPPRDFTNPTWSRSTSPETVRDLIRDGKRGTPMPAFPSLTDEEVGLVTAYVLSLGGAG